MYRMPAHQRLTTSSCLLLGRLIYYFNSETVERFLGHRFEHENRRLLIVVSGSGNIVAAQIGRPKRGAGAGAGGNLGERFVVIRILLLIDENVTDAFIAAAGNVDSFVRGVV